MNMNSSNKTTQDKTNKKTTKQRKMHQIRLFKNIINWTVMKSTLNTSVQLHSTTQHTKIMVHNIPQRWVSLSAVAMKYFLDEYKDLCSVFPNKYYTKHMYDLYVEVIIM
jgi:hypothetical protein